MNHTLHKEKDICRGYLSDEDYLKHMIPHHHGAFLLVFKWWLVPVSSSSSCRYE